jgi:hypothetical protein
MSIHGDNVPPNQKKTINAMPCQLRPMKDTDTWHDKSRVLIMCRGDLAETTVVQLLLAVYIYGCRNEASPTEAENETT